MKGPEFAASMLFDLSGKTALVTGASGHLGRAIAAALADFGCRVVTGSRDLERAERAAQSLPLVSSGKHVGVVIDQMEPESIDRGFGCAVQSTGSIDILVNNGHELIPKDWQSVTYEEFGRHQRSTAGYFELARKLRNHVVDRNAAGNVIMLGSMYGQVASYPEVYDGISAASPAAYHALKGGILQLTRHLAVYWAKDHVRVNSLSPGAFPSENVDPALIDRINTKVPLGRIGRPDELKGAVVFLASHASSYVTGHNLVVDGGWTAW